MKSFTRFLLLVLVIIVLITYVIFRYHAVVSDPLSLDEELNSKLLRSDHVGVIVKPTQSASLPSVSSSLNHTVNGTKHNRPPQIVVAVVACGDRLDETLTMIKSAILFTRSPLRFVVMSDADLAPSFVEKLTEWAGARNDSFTFDVLPIAFPQTEDVDEWRKLFKPCAAQRLFLPSILSNVDSLLYVDTDTLFLGPLEDVWSHFGRMNSSQMAALTPEHEDPNTGWYNRFARHPYYGKLGVNSGVMLMNLTRMREFSWTDYVIPVYKEYKLSIIWGDQDIINIIFHYHPDKLYVYPCRYNYRPDHCMYMSVCKSAEAAGVAVLHGSRGSFHSERQPAFKVIHQAMQEYSLGADPYGGLYLPMKNYLDSTGSTTCGKVRHVFLKSIQAYVKKPADENS